MRLSFFAVVLLSLGAPAFSVYDSSWHQEEFWSAEYPSGFAVVKEGIVVPARTGMDKDLPTNVQCELPYKAVFQPWNGARNDKSHAKYFTASKIVKLVAKNAFLMDTDNEEKVAIKKNQEIEFLIYGSEGWFTVRVNGKVYVTSQELFENVEPVDISAFMQDEWLVLHCENNVAAWLFLSDLVQRDAEVSVKYAPGIGDWGPGMVDYGTVRDLP